MNPDNHNLQQKHPSERDFKLALHMLLKVFATTEKTKEQQKYYDAAKDMLTRSFKITDVLRQARGEAAQRDGWIPVSERLPKEGDWVLCAIPGGVLTELCQCWHGKFVPAGSPCEDDRITHWQPINPPQTESK